METIIERETFDLVLQNKRLRRETEARRIKQELQEELQKDNSLEGLIRILQEGLNEARLFET